MYYALDEACTDRLKKKKEILDSFVTGMSYHMAVCEHAIGGMQKVSRGETGHDINAIAP